MSRKRKISRAEEVLDILGLSECADNYVGGDLLKGISGGEKRRLSLAVEMIGSQSLEYPRVSPGSFGPKILLSL